MLRHALPRECNLEIKISEPTEPAGAKVADHLLHMSDLPSAVLIGDDIVARGVCSRLVAHDVERARQLTIIVPYIKGSGISYPLPLVRIEFEAETIMDSAASMLLDLIDGRAVASRTVIIPPSGLITDSSPSLRMSRQSALVLQSTE